MFQEEVYNAALTKRDAFERMKELLAELFKEKRSCEEAIRDQITERRQKKDDVRTYARNALIKQLWGNFAHICMCT